MRYHVLNMETKNMTVYNFMKINERTFIKLLLLTTNKAE